MFVPFATPDQMVDRSRGAITVASHPFLPSALKAASKEIRKHCRWHVATRETITRAFTGPRPADLWIPALEIASIDEATLDGVPLDVSGIVFNPETGWTSLRTWGRVLSVTFTAGFEEVPDDIVDLTLHVAARSLGSPLGAIREQAGPVSVTWSATAPNVSGGTVLLEHEKDSLAEYQIGRTP